MKHLILIMVLFITINADAQTFSMKAGKSTSTHDSTTLVIEGKSFKVFINSNNNYYINRLSKSGNQYKQYLGYATENIFNGLPVFTDSKKQKYWTLAIGKTGYPAKRELDVQW